MAQQLLHVHNSIFIKQSQAIRNFSILQFLPKPYMSRWSEVLFDQLTNKRKQDYSM